MLSLLQHITYSRGARGADYHLHVHVAHVHVDGGQGMAAGKAHLLDDVIGATAPCAAVLYLPPWNPSTGRRARLLELMPRVPVPRNTAHVLLITHWSTSGRAGDVQGVSSMLGRVLPACWELVLPLGKARCLH